MLTYVDKVFKTYAVEEYGDIFSDQEIENARVMAFCYWSDYCKSMIEQGIAVDTQAHKGEVKMAFLEYLKLNRQYSMEEQV